MLPYQAPQNWPRTPFEPSFYDNYVKIKQFEGNWVRNEVRGSQYYTDYFGSCRGGGFTAGVTHLCLIKVPGLHHFDIPMSDWNRAQFVYFDAILDEKEIDVYQPGFTKFGIKLDAHGNVLKRVK